MPKTAAEIQEEWNEFFARDPVGATAQMVALGVKQGKAEQRAEFNQYENLKQFWSRVFSHAPEMKGHKDLMERVLNKNIAEIGKFKESEIDDAIERLIELSKAEISYQKRLTAHMEGDAGVMRGIAGDPDYIAPMPEEQGSLSRAINDRKARRREHQLGIQPVGSATRTE